MTDKDKRALLNCLLYLMALALIYQLIAPYWAYNRVEQAHQDYIQDKIESYEDIEIAKALRIMRWLQRQGGGQNLEH